MTSSATIDAQRKALALRRRSWLGAGPLGPGCPRPAVAAPSAPARQIRVREPDQAPGDEHSHPEDRRQDGGAWLKTYAARSPAPRTTRPASPPPPSNRARSFHDSPHRGCPRRLQRRDDGTNRMQPRSETIPHPGRRGKGPGSRDAGYRTGRDTGWTPYLAGPGHGAEGLGVKIGRSSSARTRAVDHSFAPISPTRSSPNPT